MQVRSGASVPGNEERIFLAYADDDRMDVFALYDRLKRHGFAPWIDVSDLVPGENKASVIADAIRNSPIVLACLSSNSVARAGRLHRQLRQALSVLAEKPPGETFLIPVRFDSCDLPAHSFENLGLKLRDLHQADLFKPDGFERLGQALKTRLGQINPAPAAPIRCDDRLAEVMRSFEALHAASIKAVARTNHPAAAAVRDSFAVCLDDLKSGVADFEMLATLPDFLVGLRADIDEHLLDRHFEAMPAKVVLKKLEALTKATGLASEHRVDSLDHRGLVDELKKVINTALNDLPAAGLDRETSEIAERELRHLRREVIKPRLDAKVVGERRRRLEDLKVDLLERTILLAEALLADGFPRLPTGTVFRDVPELWCPQMVMIPKGVFFMGSAETEIGRSNGEGPQHQVTIDRPFGLGRYPVQRSEYATFAKAACHKSKGAMVYLGFEDFGYRDDADWTKSYAGASTNTDRCPVNCVSLEDVRLYCAWLSQRTNQVYKLPSEAEWEYACRAGTITSYHFGNAIDSNFVWSNENFLDITEVGRFPANEFGLFDMHGLVWEWCEDRWHENYSHAPVDGSCWIKGGDRQYVCRGGSSFSEGKELRSAHRSKCDVAHRNEELGFRLVRIP